MLEYSSQIGEADWIVCDGVDPDRLITFGPARFDAYARVLFLPDPAFPGQFETDAGDLPGGLSKLEVLIRAVGTLQLFTQTPKLGFFAVWDSGMPMASPIPRGHARLEVPQRDSFLIEGPLSGLSRWYDDLGLNPYDHPSFIWPADHAWCIAADVDPHWAGVGASAAAIERLLAAPGLDCVAADPDEPVARYN